ncbi:MAG: hypothetical protein ABSG43_20880 [Solirubrobacteraceae bacterium]
MGPVVAVSADVINGLPAADRGALMQDLFGQSSSGSGLPAPAINLHRSPAPPAR